MLKSDEEIDALLNNKNNALKKPEVAHKIIGQGNHGNYISGEGTKQRGHQIRDPEEQATIGALANLIGNKATIELTGMSAHSVSAFKNGKNGNGAINPELVSKLDEKLDRANEKVVDKLDVLLELFSEEKMEGLEAKEIPPALERLVNISDKIRRKNEGKDGANTVKPQVIIYAPKQLNINELITKEVVG